MTCQHFGPEDPRNSWVLPGTWFFATLTGGECPHCGRVVNEGEEVRSDGQGSYEHRDCVIKKEDQMGLLKIEPTAEWARFLRELSRQAEGDGIRISGVLTITDLGTNDKIVIGL